MLHPFKPTRWQDYLWTTAVWQKMIDGMAKVSNLPVLGPIALQLLGHVPEAYGGVTIPVNKRLEDQGTTILPITVLKEMIRRSAHRVILHQCPCRQGMGCQDYPNDIGCIYLGEATKDMDPSFGIHASVDEALAHVDRAVEAGLIPGMGQVDLDCLYLGCLPKTHFASVCFCCSCCCVMYRNGYIWSPDVQKLWHKLEGIKIEVTDTCVGCGECLNKCWVAAISLEDGQARIDEKRCKGCGICVENCPSNAISIEVTDGEKMRKGFYEFFDSRVDIVSSIPGKKVNAEGRDRVPHPRWGYDKVKIRHSREK
jgi:ferredoxin